MTWTDRARALRSWLRDWVPSVVSLQYVPYSFSSRGLPFGLAAWLRRTLPERVTWQVMFHELWVGITFRSPWRHHVVGALQRQIVRDLVRALGDPLCHTSNPLYVQLLYRAGIPATRLPICSNLAVTREEHPWMAAQLSKLGILPEQRGAWWIVGQFGSCYPDYPLAAQARDLASRAAAKGCRLALLGVGGGTGTGQVWEDTVRSAVPGVVTRHFGRQPEARVSAFMGILDLGLPNTPRQFVGKSGAAAALQAHGVPLDGAYQVDLPEHRYRWHGGVTESELFWPADRIAERMECDLHAAPVRFAAL